jgi:hypothetical protein
MVGPRRRVSRRKTIWGESCNLFLKRRLKMVTFVFVVGLFASPALAVLITAKKILTGASKAVQGPTGRRVAGSVAEHFIKNLLR